METRQRKLLSVLCHASILFSFASILIATPIIILISTSDRIVRANAKEAINYQISLFTYLIITVMLGVLGGTLYEILGKNLAVMSLPANLTRVVEILTLAILAVSAVCFILLWLSTLVMPFFAIGQIVVRPNLPYRYPLIFRLL